MRRLSILCLVLLVTVGAAKDPRFKERSSAFKKALRPAAKGQAVPVKASLKAVREFGELPDERVFKDLVKSIPGLLKRIAAADEELVEATFKLEQVRIPYFERIEEEFRRTGKWPETILVRTRDALDTLGKIQAAKAADYDAWVRIRDAVYEGLGATLVALGEDRDRVWKQATRDGAESKVPEVRAAICMALREVPDRKAEEILLAFEASDEDPVVVARALSSLAARGSEAAFERLKARLSHGAWEVEVVAVRGLGRYRHEETLPALIGRLKTAEGRIFADLLEALFDLTGKHLPDTYAAWDFWWKKDGEAFLTRWSEDREKRISAIEEISMADPQAIDVPAEIAALLSNEPETEIRQELVDILSIHRSHYARLVLLKTLWDADAELRLAAIRGLAHYRHLSVPPALMRRVDVADEAELTALFQALRRLWGGRSEFTVSRADREALHRWWGLNKGRVGKQFVRLGARDVAAGKPPAKIDGRFEDRNFYGLRILSKRVLFVVDISISMEEPAVKGKKRRKIEVAKSELTRVIRSLPDDAIFGFIVFASTAKLYGEGMVPATPANRKRALGWVDALTTKAATNIYDTLELCFQVGMPGSPVKSRVRPDTIFFVSDGAPTAGKFTDGNTILEHVRRWNERRHLKIHAIGVGEDHDVDFLRKLAVANGGHYVAR